MTDALPGVFGQKCLRQELQKELMLEDGHYFGDMMGELNFQLDWQLVVGGSDWQMEVGGFDWKMGVGGSDW